METTLDEWMKEDRIDQCFEVLETNSIPYSCNNCPFHGRQLLEFSTILKCFLMGTKTVKKMTPHCEVERFTSYVIERT